jgi:hypothetical protein
MTTNRTYSIILASMPPGLEKKVLEWLLIALESGDHTFSREALIVKIFGYSVPHDKLNTSTEDRQIRTAIKNLIVMGYPVISNSGEGGYRLEANAEAREAYILEIESRAERLKDKARDLRKANRLEWRPVAPAEIQMSLLHEGQI